MIIALDYDGTFSRDPELWRDFIYRARRVGHQVIMVTQRTEECKPFLIDKIQIPLHIICCSGCSKVKATIEAGYMVDVWIDDNPYGILAPLTYTGPIDA